MQILSGNPTIFSQLELNQATKLIDSGHRLIHLMTINQLNAAHSICMVKYNDAVIGVGAIKISRDEYVKSVYKQACIIDDPIPRHEIGWFVIDPLFRGMGLSFVMNTRLLDKFPLPIFATATEKGRPHQLVQKFGFIQIGNFESKVTPGAVLALLERRI